MKYAHRIPTTSQGGHLLAKSPSNVNLTMVLKLVHIIAAVIAVIIAIILIVVIALIASHEHKSDSGTLLID